jgi:hypothetical protein
MLTAAVIHAEDVQSLHNGAMLEIDKPYLLQHWTLIQFGLRFAK